MLGRHLRIPLLLLALVGGGHAQAGVETLDDATLNRMILGLEPEDTPVPKETKPLDPSTAGMARNVQAMEPAETALPTFSFYHEGFLGAGTGYRKNVLFASENEVDSLYEIFFGEWSGFVLPRSGLWSAYALLQAEWETFFEHRDRLHPQSLFVALIGADWNPVPKIKVGLIARGFYSEQYIGVAVSDTVNESVGIASTQWATEPSLTYRPFGNWRLTLRAPFEWDKFNLKGENYAQAGTGLAIGWYGSKATVSLTSTRNARAYDERPFRTRSGLDVQKSHLRWTITETKLEGHVFLGDSKVWKLNAGLTQRLVSDDYFGHDDSERWQLETGILYEDDPYRVELNLSLAQTQYSVQRIALIPLSSPLRAYDTAAIQLVTSRKLSESWRVQAGTRWEDCRSNRAGDEYTVLSFAIGFKWTFKTAD